MPRIDSFWTCITYVLSFLTLSPFDGPGGKSQSPLLPSSDALHRPHRKGPIFKPPGGRLTGPGSDFTCDYTNMPGYSSCSTPENRACWLKNTETGDEYNISTNYEDTNRTPTGIHRTYYLNITDSWLNADGLNFTEAKIFNLTYPGPWIQACWGDVRIHFSNTIFPSLSFHANMPYPTDNIDRMSQSLSTTHSITMALVFIGMGFGNG